MTMYRTFIILLLLVTSLACAQEPGKGLTSIPHTPQAPAFELNDLDGNPHRMSDYLGQVVIVNFWATWCPPCRAEMPSMQRAWDKLKQEDIVMLGIDVGEDEDTVFLFTANYPVEFPLLMDKDSKVIGEWPVRGLPTTFVVDPEGRIVYQAIGGREWDDPELMEAVRALKPQGH
jgi:peroxiredoxin